MKLHVADNLVLNESGVIVGNLVHLEDGTWYVELSTTQGVYGSYLQCP